MPLAAGTSPSVRLGFRRRKRFGLRGRYSNLKQEANGKLELPRRSGLDHLQKGRKGGFRGAVGLEDLERVEAVRQVEDVEREGEPPCLPELPGLSDRNVERS